MTPEPNDGTMPLAADTAATQGERDAAIRALEEAERRYRQLVETIPEVVWLDRIDENSTNIYMSPQVEWLSPRPEGGTMVECWLPS